jgi:protein-disulfide isomerase
MSGGSLLAADAGTHPGDAIVLAEVDGVKLTLADLERKNPTGLFQARNTFFDAERKVVEQFIDQHLLERRAKKENVTVDELLEIHVNRTVPKDPPEEALRVYYEGVDTTEPYETVRPQILDAIRQRRLAKAKNTYVQSLRSEAKIAIRLSPPRTPVSLSDTPVRGSADAPVVLVEFADFECPYCQQAHPALSKLVSDYGGKVAFAYKDAPLPMHARAQKAAEAAHCAGAQGKYWEYFDLLFTSRQLEMAQLKEQAQQLKLDGKAFDACLDSGQQSALVKSQLAEAQTLGLQGTPSFFINGRFFSGALNYETLRGIVEEELSALSPRHGEGAERQ